MTHLLTSLAVKPPKFDTLLHIGAGPDFDEALYQALPALRYILVEADAESAESIRNLADPKKFRIVEKLVAPEPGEKTFRRFSLPSLNGLLRLGGLQSIYPRAREVQTIATEAQTLSQLAAGLQLAHGKEHALILNVPGLEADLLAEALGAGPFLFDWIFLTGAAPPLMDQAKPLVETLQLAGKHHFQIKTQDQNRDPLQPIAFLQRDRRALELQSLRRERDARTKERDNAAKERDALKKTATDRAMRIAELEAQVADQAERQRQIDEEMAKAEGQLDMLKDLLRPSLT